MDSEYPKILFLGEKGILFNKLAKTLQNKLCNILCLSTDINPDSVTLNKINVIGDEELNNNNIDYIIGICDENINNNEWKKLLHIINKVNKTKAVKTIIIFPYSFSNTTLLQLNSTRDVVFHKCEHVGYLFVGDLIDIKNSVYKSELVRQIDHIKKGEGKESLSKSYYFPTEVNDSAEEIVKLLFSLRAYGAKTAVIGKRISAKDILRISGGVYLHESSSESNKLQHPVVDELIMVNSDFERWLASQKPIKDYREPDRFEIKKLDNDVKSINVLNNFHLPLSDDNITQKKNNETPTSGNIVNSNSSVSVNNVATPNDLGLWQKKFLNLLIKKPGNLTKLNKFHLGFMGLSKPRLLRSVGPVFIFSFISVFYVLIPLLLLILSKVFLGLGGEHGGLAQYKISNHLYVVTGAVSGLGKRYNQFLSLTPFVSGFYKDISNTQDLINKISDVGLQSNSMSIMTSEVFVNLWSNNFENIEVKSNQLSIEMDNIYKKLSFLQADIESSGKTTKTLLNLELKQIAKARNELSHFAKLSNQLPVLLGKDKPVKYLLVLQNDNVKKPTGGMIQGLGVVTISNGKLLEYSFFSPQELDKGLKGYVEPPLALKTHFGKQIWQLEDANWDVDFKTSAQKIEWFLDKQSDTSLNGVIAVNFSIWSKMIEMVNISTNKKNNVLADGNTEGVTIVDVAERFMTSLEGLNSNDSGRLLATVNSGLKHKMIQIFVHDKKSQNTLSELNWDGSLIYKRCQGINCYSDFLAVFESSLYSNKDVLVKAELQVFLEENLIKRNLVLFFDNSKSIEDYYTYLRLVALQDAGFEQAEIIGGSVREKFTTELSANRGFKEAGVLVKLHRGETKAVIFKWESGMPYKLADLNSYQINWQKQSGSGGLPVQIDVVVETDKNELLTNDGKFHYNTTLSEDRLIKFNIR